MNTNIIILITNVACLLTIVGIPVGAKFLAKHKVNATAILSDVDKGVAYASSIANAVKPFLPTIADNVIDVTLKYAGQAITRVEATYKASLLTGTVGTDTRKAEANNLITSSLAMEGIPMTSDTQKLIDTVIPMLVLALPKTNDDSVTATQTPEATEQTVAATANA
jgi:hypothetical protein